MLFIMDVLTCDQALRAQEWAVYPFAKVIDHGRCQAGPKGLSHGLANIPYLDSLQ